MALWAVRAVGGIFISGIVISCGLWLVPAIAKIPGEVHCYGAVCHRVKSLVETRDLVGQVIELTSSYYDDPA